MYDDDQIEYTIETISSCKEEAESASRKAFWQALGVSACIILIGAASVLAKKEIIPEDIATVSQVALGIGGTGLLAGTINNATRSALSENRAKVLTYNKKMDKLSR